MKFSQYNIEHLKNGKPIWVNLRTSKWVRISSQDVLDRINYLKETNDFSKDNPIDKAFYDRGFIVDDDFNEYEDMKQWWISRIEENRNRLHIMVYTTDQCNFRCIYCPEEHLSRNLSDEHWNGLFNFIKNGVEKNELDEISICFFGGEPLLETNKILKFLYKLDKLKKDYPNVQYFHTMTTNGYLLTPELYQELNMLGLKRYQITVDGFKETHDAARPRVDGQGTWDVVVNNLKGISILKENLANVVIRINSNEKIEPTLEEFYKWANETFTNEYFTFDIQGVSNFSGNLDENLLSKDDAATQIKNNEIKKQYKDRRSSNDFNVLTKGCMACRTANRNCYALLTNGTITICEAVYMGKDTHVGKLKEDGSIEFKFDINEIYINTEYEECEDCIQYPLCGGRACPYRRLISTDVERLDCNKKDENKFLEKARVFIETSGVFD